MTRESESPPGTHPLAGEEVTATVLVDEEDVEPWTVTGILHVRWVDTLKYTQHLVGGHPVKAETIRSHDPQVDARKDHIDR